MWCFLFLLGGGGWKFVFVIFTKLIPRRIFFCIAKILVLMVIQEPFIHARHACYNNGTDSKIPVRSAWATVHARHGQDCSDGILAEPLQRDAAFVLTVGSLLLAMELFYLQLTILASLLAVGAFLLTVLAFVLTVGAFLLTVGKCV